jgi:hypothetical protein
LSDPENSSSLFLLLIAFAVLLGASNLGLGSVASPGPGFLAFLAAVVLAFSSGIHLISNILSKTPRSNETIAQLWAGTRWRKVTYVVLALLLYSIFLEQAGFILLTFLMMFFLLKITGVKPWYKALMAGALITIGSYLLFERYLKIGFPAGILGF